MDKELQDKIGALEAYISGRAADGICLAFSGGTDSALLLYLLSRLESPVLAVTFSTPLQPAQEIELAKALAAEYGIEHLTAHIDVMQDNSLINNPCDRCYRCKKYLFSRLGAIAREHGLKHVFDGTNADDLNVYRPGLKALKELGVHSPLAQTGMTKPDVRRAAGYFNIRVAKRPSAPCMATRFPYNTKLDLNIMRNLEKGEELIKSFGIETVRIRYYNGLARIEVLPDDFQKVLNNRPEIISGLKNLGLQYITLDIEGFRSGSMDIGL